MISKPVKQKMKTAEMLLPPTPLPLLFVKEQHLQWVFRRILFKGIADTVLQKASLKVLQSAFPSFPSLG